MKRQIEIQKRVKRPKSKHGFYSLVAEQMQVGDSVLMEDTPEASRVCDALKRRGCKSIQKLEAGGCRVWRTK